MKTLLITFGILCSISGFSQSFGNKIDPANGFSEKLKTAGEKTQSITCNFNQTKHLAVLTKANVSTGKFFFKKEQNICLEYTIPTGNLIVMSGGKFKIVADGKTNVVDMRSNPMMRQMGAMLTACMTGDIQLFGSDSNTEYFETSTTYTVVISPNNRRVKKYLKQIVLTFDKQDMTLNSMQMKENDTDFTQYQFSDKKLNSSFGDDKFKI